MMCKKVLMMTGVLLLFLAGCGTQETPKADVAAPVVDDGNRAMNGLVCEGTNDTLLIYLPSPYDGSDPDTLNILAASKARRVFGIANIGDNVIILRNDSDAKVADMVIAIQDLYGKWGYEVYPTLRERADAPALEIPDTFLQMLTVAKEYTLDFRQDQTMRSMSARMERRSIHDESPIEYPKPRRYTAWTIYNDHLLMSVSALDTLGQSQVVAVDTAEFVIFMPDTLVLRINGEEKAFSKK